MLILVKITKKLALYSLKHTICVSNQRHLRYGAILKMSLKDWMLNL
jgi:hypothetical protein